MLENVQQQNLVKFNTPQKRVLKNQLRQLSRKISNSSSSFTPDSGHKSIESTNRMFVSQSLGGEGGRRLGGALSRKTQSKAKSTVRNKKLPRGTSFQLCKELGLNLSNKEDKQVVSETPLQKSIKSFFCWDDVTRVCPDMKKMATNLDNCDEKVPVRYRMSSLGARHEKFVEEIMPCSLSHFQRKLFLFRKKAKCQ